MGNKKVCIISQFPPPMHGLSKAVDTIYHSYLREEFEIETIDIKDNKRISHSILSIIKSKADLFYFTISQSKWGNLRDLLILRLILLKKKKSLVHLHGGYYRRLVDNDVPTWQRKANYRVISKLDGVIVLGKSLKYIFEGMISDKKIFVVPNCVDDKYLISNEEFEKKMSDFNDIEVKNILYLSNFIKTKGYPELLELAQFHKKECANGAIKKFHFHFAGDFFESAEKEFFFDYIKRNGLDDFVTYHGVVGGDKKLELLRSCEIFALPTRYKNEGQPISIIEAMANGMVVLTTNYAGIPDLIQDGRNGVILRDPYVIKDVLDIINELDLQAIAVRNRKEVLDGYLQLHYLRNIKAVWERVLTS